MSQVFEIEMHCADTGETWAVRVDAADPPAALSKVLRRRMWAEQLCSELPHSFVVKDTFGLDL